MDGEAIRQHMEKISDTSATAKQVRENAALRAHAEHVAVDLVQAQAAKKTAQEHLATVLHSALSHPASNTVAQE